MVWIVAYVENFNSTLGRTSADWQGKITWNVAWIPHPLGLMKINSNASITRDKYGYGSIVRIRTRSKSCNGWFACECEPIVGQSTRDKRRIAYDSDVKVDESESWIWFIVSHQYVNWQNWLAWWRSHQGWGCDFFGKIVSRNFF